MAAILAIGLMPAMAFADEAVAPTASDETAFLANDVTYNQAADENGDYIFGFTNKPVDFKVTGVTNINGVSLVEGTDYEYAYFSDTNGTLVTTAIGGQDEAGKAPINPGTYYIGTYKKDTTPADDNTIYQAFVIKSASLDNAFVYQVNGKDLSDVSDTTFNYTGDAYGFVTAAPTAADNGKLWIAIDGKPMDFTADIASIAFTDVSVTGTTNVGTYKVKVVGDGDYAGLTRYLDIDVTPFDLSQATMTIIDGDATTYASTAPLGAATTKISLGGDELAASAMDTLGLTTTAFSGPNTSGIPSGYTTLGKYTVSAAVKADANAQAKANVINSASTSFTIATATAAYFEYAGTALTGSNYTESNPLAVNTSNPFTVSNIVVDKTDSSKADLLTINKDYTVTVTKGGSVVTSYTEPGLYKVDVAVKTGSDYALNGSRTFYFQVTKGTLAAANVFVSVNNANIAGVDTTDAVADYTGEAQAVNVVVKDADGNKLAQGTDYNVEVTDADGNVVTDVVNAGIYTVKVTSDVYAIAATDGVGTFKFKVGPVVYTGIRVAGVVTINKTAGSFTGLPYTGAEIVPAYEYTTDDITDADKFPAGIADKNVTWKTLPAEAYAASYVGPLTDDTIVKTGLYTVTLANNDDEANKTVAANYDVANAGVDVWGGVVASGTPTIDDTFSVIDAKVFADVPATAWFASVVADAAEQGYMSGYYGTKLFGPYDQITRADVACVLFNMAGGRLWSDEGMENENIAFSSKFSDVDKSMYYAQAVGWAAKIGVVNGYGNGTFAPEKQITREEFAAMLANYAKAMGDDMTVDASTVLAGFSDGAQVSAWAQDVVAWCAANEIMGNGGFLAPQSTITRAEVAAMAINYQPVKLS